MSFKKDTPDIVCAILEHYNRQKPQRYIRLYYGDAATGRCWMEEHDTIGTVGRSCGQIKIPLLVKAGDDGGGAILDHCIVKITDNGKIIYQHPAFHMPTVLADGKQVLFDGEIYANCSSPSQANRLAQFMCGEIDEYKEAA